MTPAPYVVPEMPASLLDADAGVVANAHADVPAVDGVTAEQAALAARAAHLAILHPARSRGNAILLSPAFDSSAALRGRELATSTDAAAAGFVSLQRFAGARRGDDLACINSFAWADLEIGPGSPFRGLPPEIVAGIVLQRLDDAGVPRPSYVLHSGRGLWLVWLAQTALPPRVRGRVRRALRALWGEAVTTGRGAGTDRVRAKAAAMAGLWEGVDLDRSVGDLARVHRIAGSINPKSGQRVRLVWPDSWTDVERGDFEFFADAVLPYTRAETEAYLAERDAAREARRARAEAEGRPVAERRVRIAYGRHAAIEQDLMRLATHLGPERARELRIRTLLAHHISCARARAGLGGDAAAWAAELAPLVGLSEKALRTALRPVEERLRRHEAGETVEYRGREVSPLYWHRDDTIMIELGLTEALAREAGLVRLIPGTDAGVALTPAERQAQARRRGGAVTRSEHAGTLEEVASLARALTRDADLPVAEVARLLDCSRATVYRALQAHPEAPQEADATRNEACPCVSVPSRSLSGGEASEAAPTPTQAPLAPATAPEAAPTNTAGKAVSCPVRPSPSAKVRLVLPVAGEALPADWDLAERTEALTAHFERKDRAELAYAHHILGVKVDLRATRSSRARAMEQAEEMAQREWDEGRRLVDSVPDRLSDREKARRAKVAAPSPPRPRRPMPRPRRPSTTWFSR